MAKAKGRPNPKATAKAPNRNDNNKGKAGGKWKSLHQDTEIEQHGVMIGVHKQTLAECVKWCKQHSGHFMQMCFKIKRLDLIIKCVPMLLMEESNSLKEADGIMTSLSTFLNTTQQCNAL